MERVESRSDFSRTIAVPICKGPEKRDHGVGDVQGPEGHALWGIRGVEELRLPAEVHLGCFF